MKPNIFIVGMPRAGTSNLHNAISQHPEAFMSEDKEPHFFGSDLHRNTKMVHYNEDEYLNLFKEGKEKKVRGESSTFYLYSKEAPKEIYEFNNDAKIIILLRNPADAIFSLHHKNYNPKNYSFEQILEMEDMGVRDHICKDVWIEETYTLKKNIYLLPEQIDKFLDIFGHENVKIIFFQDLKKNTDNIYKEVFKFIGISSEFKVEKTQYNNSNVANNSTFAPRNRFLQNFIYKHSGANGFLGKMRRLLFKKPPKFINYLKSLNVDKNDKIDKMSKKTRNSLINEFSQIISSIEKITGRNLDEWRK